MLNRIVRWAVNGLDYEADPRQIETLLEDLELVGEDVKIALQLNSSGVIPFYHNGIFVNKATKSSRPT